MIVISVRGDKAEWVAADNDYLVQINSGSHVRPHSRNRWEFQQVRGCNPVTLDKYCLAIVIVPKLSYFDLEKLSLKNHKKQNIKMLYCLNPNVRQGEFAKNMLVFFSVLDGCHLSVFTYVTLVYVTVS